MFLSFVLLLATATVGGAPSVALQDQTKPEQSKPTTNNPVSVSPTPGVTKSAAGQGQSEVKPTVDKAGSSAGQKAVQQKKPAWTVSVRENFGVPFLTVRAKKAPLTEVAAELERVLKVPVVLGTNMKKQQLTADFEDYNLEAAVKALAPRPVLDYEISGGGDTLHPSRKKVVSIYLLDADDKAPQEGPWVANKSGMQMLVGMIYDSEAEEKAAVEVKKQELQVNYSDGLFTLRIYKQFLTDVLEEVAGQAHVPFAILTQNGSQKEIDQMVTWNVSGVSFEELVNTWFPNGVRLYWRTDLVNDVSKPLRLTIEDREDVQAVQNVTP